MPSEKTIEQKIIKLFRQHGHIAMKYHGDGYGVSSHSDLYGVLQPWGFAFFLEIKKPGEKPTEAQEEFLNEMHDAGSYVGWADSFEEAQQLLDDWESEAPLFWAGSDVVEQDPIDMQVRCV